MNRTLSKTEMLFAGMKSNPIIIPVTGGVYAVIRRSYFTCSYLIARPDGIFLIDAGMNSSGADMLFALSQIGRRVEDVRAILLTHWHNDHSAGAGVIQQLSNAKVYYHGEEAKFLTRETASLGLRATLSELVPESGPLVLIKGLLGSATTRAVEATQLVNDNDLLEKEFQVIATPGHTEGHVSYYYHPQKILFAGDALAVVGGRVRPMARFVTPDIDRARQSMLRCLEYPIDFLCPGHRAPLLSGVAEACASLKSQIQSGAKWPLFG